jgi:Chaperone of endosialidase
MPRNLLFGLLALCISCETATAQNCPTYPYTLTNGTNADASQVMANFNAILNCTMNPIHIASGNVGIGTAFPTDLLNLYRSGQGNTGITVSSDAGTSVYLTANRGQGASNPLTQVGDASITYSVIAVDTGALTIGQWSNSPRGMRIDASGNVGIGIATPAVRLSVAGDIRVGTSGTNGCVQRFDGAGLMGTCVSDASLKKNIASLNGTNVLARLTLVEPASFEWRAKEFPQMQFGQGHQLGLIAQQTEEHFPELVETDGNGFKKVRYSELPIYMLQALRELKAENDKLRAELKIANDNLEGRLRALEDATRSRRAGAHSTTADSIKGSTFAIPSLVQH